MPSIKWRLPATLDVASPHQTSVRVIEAITSGNHGATSVGAITGSRDRQIVGFS